MKVNNRILNAGTIAASTIFTASTPMLATAAPGHMEPAPGQFHAFSSLQDAELIAMSETELDHVQGEFFNFGLNFAFAPQFNICIFCNGVNQSNIAMIFGFNGNP